MPRFQFLCAKGTQTQVQGPLRASHSLFMGWGHTGTLACPCMQGACMGGPLWMVTCRAKERQAVEAGLGSPGGGGQAGS